MRRGIIPAIIVLWLIIGAVAAGQRGYLTTPSASCAKTGKIAVTILAGPLNYFGANPKTHCLVPQPSQ